MMKSPLLSVVMATFDEPPEQVSCAIQSILNQTFKDFELFIIDDSTRSDTKAAIDRLADADNRVEVIREENRIGFVPALNMGLKRARGKYIARMDGDDIAVVNRFECQVTYLENTPGVDVLGGALDIIDQDAKCISHRDYPANSFRVKLFALMRSPVAHPAVMMRQSIVEDGFLYDETFSKSEDLELWMRLMKHGYRISNLEETVLQFRVCGDLGSKRTRDHFRYNYRARKQNFSWKSPGWSLGSIMISRMYSVLPKFVVSMAYRMENTKKK